MYKLLIGILLLSFVSQLTYAQIDVQDEDLIEDVGRELLEGIDEPVPEVYDESNEEEDAAEEYNQSSNDKELDLRHVDEAEWIKLKRDKRFQYKKKKKKEKKSIDPPNLKWLDGLGRFFGSTFFIILLYILLGGFLIFIVYLFIKNNNISFRKNIKDKKIVQEDPWEDVTRFEDWELALQKALADEDYRLATRIYYLHTLNILDKNSFIKYREDKTNWYYVQKLFGTPLHDTFKELTRSFDYIWYGEYQINKAQFEALANQFKNFKVQIT